MFQPFCVCALHPGNPLVPNMSSICFTIFMLFIAPRQPTLPNTLLQGTYQALVSYHMYSLL